MAGKTKKQLATMAHTVTGIGWGDTDQACIYASISMPTLRQWRANGLRSAKIGHCVRIKYSDIDAYLQAQMVNDVEDLDMDKIRKIAMEAVADL